MKRFVLLCLALTACGGAETFFINLDGGSDATMGQEAGGSDVREASTNTDSDPGRDSNVAESGLADNGMDMGLSGDAGSDVGNVEDAVTVTDSGTVVDSGTDSGTNTDANVDSGLTDSGSSGDADDSGCHGGFGEDSGDDDGCQFRDGSPPRCEQAMHCCKRKCRVFTGMMNAVCVQECSDEHKDCVQ